jgi:hypothetical protein
MLMQFLPESSYTWEWCDVRMVEYNSFSISLHTHSLHEVHILVHISPV